MHSVNNINSLTEDIKEIFTLPRFLISIMLLFPMVSTGNHILILITYKIIKKEIAEVSGLTTEISYRPE